MSKGRTANRNGLRAWLGVVLLAVLFPPQTATSQEFSVQLQASWGSGVDSDSDGYFRSRTLVRSGIVRFAPTDSLPHSVFIMQRVYYSTPSHPDLVLFSSGPNLILTIAGGSGGGLFTIPSSFVTIDSLEHSSYSFLATIELTESGFSAGDSVWLPSALFETAAQDSTMVGIDLPTPDPLPTSLALLQNYPNPFNPSTVVGYTLAANSHVTLSILNALGQEVDRPVDAIQDAGYHSVVWNAADPHGHAVGSGVYFSELRASGARQLRRMILLK